jgi:hypothetical protein
MVTMEAPTTPATPTERMVASMLVENTGSHFLDSGGAYGRAWQHTRAAYGLNPSKNSPFSGGPLGPDPDPTEDEIEHIALAMREGPEGYVDSFGVVTIDTFHWLVDRLDYQPDLDRKWRRYVDKLWAASGHRSNDYVERIPWTSELGAIERFLDALREHGADARVIDSDNSYNHECLLDRTIQYTLFAISNPIDWSGGIRRIDTHSTIGEPFDRLTEFLPDGVYLLLQIHGGADVRGGYTDARLFSMGNDEYDAISDLSNYDEAQVWCDGANVVPEHQSPGQITIEAEVLEPQHVSHYWTNSDGYGGTMLRLFDPQAGEALGEALAFKYDESTEDDEPSSYENNLGITAYNISRKEHVEVDGIVVGHRWPCPFDGSDLHVSGAIVS